MPKQVLTIPGRLPGLNEMNSANRCNRYAGAKQKEANQIRITSCIYAQGLMHIDSPVRMHFRFYEQNRRRDPDNVFTGVKLILDALTKTGVLKDDAQRYLQMPEPYRFSLEIDKNDPRVVVEMEWN